MPIVGVMSVSISKVTVVTPSFKVKVSPSSRAERLGQVMEPLAAASAWLVEHRMPIAPPQVPQVSVFPSSQVSFEVSRTPSPQTFPVMPETVRQEESQIEQLAWP
jgi:hypothetical protein